jgi:flagellin-specific chaperone FliS
MEASGSWSILLINIYLYIYVRIRQANDKLQSPYKYVESIHTEIRQMMAENETK